MSHLQNGAYMRIMAVLISSASEPSLAACPKV